MMTPRERRREIASLEGQIAHLRQAIAELELVLLELKADLFADQEDKAHAIRGRKRKG